MKLKFEIDKKFDRRYQECREVLKYSRSAYQRSWDLIGDAFSRYIESRTGYAWFYPEYKCVLSPVQIGIANWGEAPVIVRSCLEHPLLSRRITAHELIISHYFEIHRRHYADAGLIDGQIWALAEIAAFALTSLTPEAKRFWPWDDRGYYYDHNYPQLVDLQKKMKATFLKSGVFSRYIESGQRMVREFKGIHP